jgi:hypothetical protein
MTLPRREGRFLCAPGTCTIYGNQIPAFPILSIAARRPRIVIPGSGRAQFVTGELQSLQE